MGKEEKYPTRHDYTPPTERLPRELLSTFMLCFKLTYADLKR